jgi:hypothetical protein
MTAPLRKPNPGLTIIRKGAWVPEDIEHKIKTWDPKTQLGQYVRDVAGKHLPGDVMAELIEYMSKTVIVESSLDLAIKWGPEARKPFSIEELGIVCRKVVTDAGVNFIVDAFQNTTELENLKYHGIGTGSTAEAAGDTALVTELTTEYNPNSTRATGTTTEGATANIYRTVATNTLDAAPGAALREHGVFSQAATGGGTLLDRSVYAAITLASGDGLQSTYELTCTSGG